MLQLKPLMAEIRKIHINNFFSIGVIFSMLIWPILSYYTAYYTYAPFDLSSVAKYGIYDFNSLMVFIITGILGYYCFWAMVQSAWMMSYERESGTLEVIMSTPANRLSIIYGRALGSLVENIWMFAAFSLMIIWLNSDFRWDLLITVPIAFVFLTVSAVVWGGLLNAIFLFSRDATFLFDVFDTPMELFSGSKIPVASFPLWARILSAIFPLSYCLVLLRDIFANRPIDWANTLILLGILLILILATVVIIKFAERNNRRKGSFTFY